LIHIKHSGWRLNADLIIISASPTGLQGSTNGMVSSAFGFNKQLIKDKLSCSAGVKNPFIKYRGNRITTPGRDFEQLNINRDYFRSFYMSVNYNFGQLKQGIKKSKTEIENNDVSK
jgi:ferric enterobactin receptor